MAREYTIQNFTDRHKPDKYSNNTYTVKFGEDERSCYASFKTEPKVGDKKYGDIIDGEYGPRFKSAQRPEFTGAQATFGASSSNPSFPPSTAQNQNKPHYEDRSKEIIWSICVKEAASYVSKENSELDEYRFADMVSEYANALFEKVLKPNADALGGDITPTDEEIDRQFDLSEVPF